MLWSRPIVLCCIAFCVAAVVGACAPEAFGTHCGIRGGDDYCLQRFGEDARHCNLCETRLQGCSGEPAESAECTMETDAEVSGDADTSSASSISGGETTSSEASGTTSGESTLGSEAEADSGDSDATGSTSGEGTGSADGGTDHGNTGSDDESETKGSSGDETGSTGASDDETGSESGGCIPPGGSCQSSAQCCGLACVLGGCL